MAQQTVNIETSGTLIEQPFAVKFNWQYKSLTVRLKNGEDILKLANIFSNMLTENGIENTIETSELKFK